MKLIRDLMFSVLLFTMATMSVSATKLGDTAPPLKVEKWVKGDAVDLSAGKGKVYVVEFWATWCPPCRKSIPHLTKLQEQYKDKGVVFIGVSQEKESVISEFVTKMGKEMAYTVACDKDNATSEAYMGAFGVNGIPHAFLIDKNGKIAWHGHPMDDMDKQIDKLLKAD
jgi:thiol-disulfide isomerase/thioredoxin